MPDVTPNYGWRIPKTDGSDFIIPDDVRLPIGSIDAALKAEENNRVAGSTALDLRLDKFDDVATDGAITGAAAVVIAANWTLNFASLTRRGKFVQFSSQIQRTVTALAGTADGNIGNITIGTVAVGYRPLLEVGISPRATGPLWGGYVNQAGVFAICSLVPNYTLPVNGQITCSAFWMIP